MAGSILPITPWTVRPQQDGAAAGPKGADGEDPGAGDWILPRNVQIAETKSPSPARFDAALLRSHFQGFKAEDGWTTTTHSHGVTDRGQKEKEEATTRGFSD